MNILLTGGLGYIGSHTAIALVGLGYRVVLLDNLANCNAMVVPRIGQILGQSLPFIQGDVRDTNLLKEILRNYQINAVIHFAGLKAVGESVERPIEYYANNVQGTVSLLQAMEAASIKTLVFSSSATVYGQPEYLPLDENHPVRATNPYGNSKLHVEAILKDVACADSAWRIVCLRYFNPVGAHASGLIGENPQGVPNNLMPYIAQVAIGQRSILNVFGNDYQTPDGTGIRDYIHVVDVAEGHAAALSYLTSHVGWQAINLGTGQGYSVFDVIKAFEKTSGRVIPYRILPRRLGDVDQCYANPSRAKQLLVWKAQRTLTEMCSSAWQFQQMNRVTPLI